LLQELQAQCKDADCIEGDFLLFPSFVSSADVIICMGDSLTHLSCLNEVELLFQQAFDVLLQEGIFMIQYRDLSKPLLDSDRFIPVKSDERTVFTCFLEWETALDHVLEDGSGSTIKVNDLVHVKKGIGAWELLTSWYRKLAMTREYCTELAIKKGFSVVESSTLDGMVFIVFKKTRN
jgi:hypothetical protein